MDFFLFMLETLETSRRRRGETLAHRVIISRGVVCVCFFFFPSLYIFLCSAIFQRSSPSPSSPSSPSSATMAAAFRLAVGAPPRRRCRRPSSPSPLFTLYSSLCCHLKCPSNFGGPIFATLRVPPPSNLEQKRWRAFAFAPIKRRQPFCRPFLPPVQS